MIDFTFDLCLVQTIDNEIFAFRDVNSLYEFVIVEGHLADIHVSCFLLVLEGKKRKVKRWTHLEVVSRRVDDCNIVLFVS